MAAPRASWKGYLKLSLVTCPVAMIPATSQSERVHFHMLNRETGNRVRSRYVDAVTHDVVEEDDQIKGYPTGKSRYVMLEDEELDAVALKTTHTIDITTFVHRDAIDRIWLDKPHYLVPDDPVGEEAYSVIREGMAATDTVGISRLVRYGRERSIMLQPRGPGIVAWTLRFGDEVRDEEDCFGDIGEERLPRNMVRLAQSVIAERIVAWDKALLADRVQEKLLKVIAAKQKGRRPPKPEAEGPADVAKVIDIMEALKRSLERESRKGSRR